MFLYKRWSPNRFGCSRPARNETQLHKLMSHESVCIPCTLWEVLTLYCGVKGEHVSSIPQQRHQTTNNVGARKICSSLQWVLLETRWRWKIHVSSVQKKDLLSVFSKGTQAENFGTMHLNKRLTFNCMIFFLPRSGWRNSNVWALIKEDIKYVIYLMLALNCNGLCETQMHSHVQYLSFQDGPL